MAGRVGGEGGGERQGADEDANDHPARPGAESLGELDDEAA